MALRTLKIKYEKHDDAVTRRRVQLCISKHSKEIYYEFEDDINQEVASESSESKQSNDSELVEESARPMPSTPQLTKSAAIITYIKTVGKFSNIDFIIVTKLLLLRKF